MSKSVPTVLYVGCDYTEHQPEEWARFTAHFNVIIYDCPSVDEFIARMAPGGEYSTIDAIMRPSWLKAPLFRGKPVDYYPPSLKIIVSGGHGYDVVDVERLADRGIVFCNSPNTCTEATGKLTYSYMRWTGCSELCDVSYTQCVSVFHFCGTVCSDRTIRYVAPIKSYCRRSFGPYHCSDRSRRYWSSDRTTSRGLRHANTLLLPLSETRSRSNLPYSRNIPHIPQLGPTSRRLYMSSVSVFA